MELNGFIEGSVICQLLDLCIFPQLGNVTGKGFPDLRLFQIIQNPLFYLIEFCDSGFLFLNTFKSVDILIVILPGFSFGNIYVGYDFFFDQILDDDILAGEFLQLCWRQTC